MAYDETLAMRVRSILHTPLNVVEKKMFGGLTFMVQGNMCCGIVKEELMLRVGADAHDEVLAQPHTRPMDFTGKRMAGFIFIGKEGIESEADLASWVQRGLDFVATLPAK
ncbi:MAG: TfoX N-terminal domain-containing protein [Chloroflexi bacterium]|jgi:TfoX/Sxy family transcriptional regulator of competence genes|nr:MAG: TfoX N-terminal domain-containing protein [Chloroflexota bacterium]